MARRVLGADNVVGAAGAFVALSAHRATKGLLGHIWAVRWRGTTPTDPARASPAPKSRFKAREKRVAYFATDVALRRFNSSFARADAPKLLGRGWSPGAIVGR